MATKPRHEARITTSDADVRKMLLAQAKFTHGVLQRERERMNERGVRLFVNVIESLLADAHDGRTYPVTDVLREYA